MGYIYLLKVKSHNTPSDLYKIGKTKDFVKRLAGYKHQHPNIELVIECGEKYHEHEINIIKLFDAHFTQQNSDGREYYSGDVEKMKSIINDIVIKTKTEKLVVKPVIPTITTWDEYFFDSKIYALTYTCVVIHFLDGDEIAPFLPDAYGLDDNDEYTIIPDYTYNHIKFEMADICYTATIEYRNYAHLKEIIYNASGRTPDALDVDSILSDYFFTKWNNGFFKNQKHTLDCIRGLQL